MIDQRLLKLSLTNNHLFERKYVEEKVKKSQVNIRALIR